MSKTLDRSVEVFFVFDFEEEFEYILKVFLVFELVILVSEAVARRCSVKKVFLKFRKIYRETHVPEPFF